MNYKYHPSEIIEYHRKSRQDDPTKTIAEVLAQHKRIADEWVADNLPGPVPDENIYMERVSGETIRDRAEFQKVLRRIESDDIKAVFVIEVQRLSRGDLEDAGHIINVFRYTNTKIITPHRIYDLADDGCRMILEMELKQGNQYLEYTKAILRRGKDDAARRGMWILSTPPYGYDITFVDKKRTLAINEKQAEVVRKIFELYASGSGFHKIASYLHDRQIKPLKSDVFSKSTIGAILTNPVYIGKIKWGSTKRQNVVVNGEIKKVKKKSDDYMLFDGLHEPIVSQELWDAAQSIRGTHVHLKANVKMINPLSGLIYCSKCGKAMRLEGMKDKHARYACPDRAFCGNGSVRTDYVYRDLKNAIAEEIENRKILIESNSSNFLVDWENECQMIRGKISALDEKELKQWEDRYESDHPMPDAVFQKLNKKLIEERNQLRQLLKYMEASKPEEDRSAEFIVDLQKSLSDFESESVDIEALNAVLKKCISRIEVSRELVKGSTHGSYDKNPYKIGITFTM